MGRVLGNVEMETHGPEALCHLPEEAKLFNYYLFNNYILWKSLQGLFKPPLSAGGDKVRTILDTVKISTVICILVPQERISWYFKKFPTVISCHSFHFAFVVPCQRQAQLHF